MKKTVGLTVFLLSLVLLFLSACNPVDKNYAVTSDKENVQSVAKTSDDGVSRPPIMSDDRVMSNFIDISLFDEENYSSIYLGKKFKFNVNFAGDEFTVPTTLSAMVKKGWKLIETGAYDENSVVYACESVYTVLENENGAKINAIFYNSSNSSVKLAKCNIVKFKIDNSFDTNTAEHSDFSVNGINSKMAISDIIDTLGMPSHFYGASEDNYFLDYFISEKDRRNGITVYINPAEDVISAIEFSYYK